MSNPAKPAWPDPASVPFTFFGNAAAPPAVPSTTGQTFVQGLAGGADFMTKLWGQMPGSTGVPGFLLPTLDLAELDKRISDLKAAESWLEVNLNLLRATVQGLEVQRHTIAAIRSLGALAEAPQPPRTAASAPPAASGLPPGWPVAEASKQSPGAAADPTLDASKSSRPASVEAAPSEPEARHDRRDALAPAAGRSSRATHKTRRSRDSAPASGPETPAASPTAALAGLAANNWLGYMQEQFAKVAHAALASSDAMRPAQDPHQPTQPVPAKSALKSAGSATKATSDRALKSKPGHRPAARKKAITR